MRTWFRTGGNRRIDVALDMLDPNDPAVPYRSAAQIDEATAATAAGVAAVHQTDRLESQAAYDELVGRGTITAIHRLGRINALASATPPVVIVTYTVPENYLFRFHKFGFQFGDPFVAQMDPVTNLPLLVRIDQQPVLGLAENNTSPYRFVPGTVWNPIDFDPIWCIGGAVITVEVNTFAAVVIHITAMAVIGGELVQRESLRLGRPV